MELHQIRYFIALADAGHFSRAAAQCHVSQPSLSRAIKKLEDELGGLLFERRPGSVTLTALGRHLLPHLRRTFDQITAVRGEADAFIIDREKILRIGMMTTVFHTQFVSVLLKLAHKFPTVCVEIEQGPADSLLQRLLGGDLDVAIICQNTVKIAEDCAVTALYDERYSFAFRDNIADDDEKEQAKAEYWSDAVLNTVPHAIPVAAQNEPDRESIRPRYRLLSQCLARAMVDGGFSGAIVPEYAAIPGLASRPIDGMFSPRQIGLVTVRGRPQYPAAAYFVRLVRGVETWLPSQIQDRTNGNCDAYGL